MRKLNQGEIPGSLVLRVVCPSCGEGSDVTGPDFDLCLWPHTNQDGFPCPDGEQKRSIRAVLAARRAPKPRPPKKKR